MRDVTWACRALQYRYAIELRAPTVMKLGCLYLALPRFWVAMISGVNSYR
jgi:hypothetical protein